jgi:predicted phage tail component-like protein
MYNFRDITETVSEGVILPSEALMINGEYIENLIPGYRTLNVSGREALSPELTTYETGIRDGSTLQNKRYPARIITVTYQLIAESNEAFREAYNQLAAILNVEEAELIFNDEPDKFFTGTPSDIGAVPPGRNAVKGEFELFCADPFKYSVVEYEATPIAGSFLIDYNGTYKSYPTLEAEFYNEDEGTGSITGNGDCGYVAFFNEEEKIIQLGNPDETDDETYSKSQTLVNQRFNTETAWGTIAQTNWAMNSGITSSDAATQAGSVSAAVAHYETTTAPSTSGTLLTKASKEAKPYIDYKVTAKTSARTADRVNVEVTIAASLAGTTNSGAVKVAAGEKVVLSNTKLYASSATSSSSGARTGTYYLWDSSVKNGRVRITNAKSRVGKSGQVTGWVNVSDLGLSAASGATLGKGYGLKAGIKFSSGDWNYATVKKESAVWSNNNSYTVKLTVTVKSLEADTDILEDIKFKVERTDDNDSKVGIIEETNCKDLEISTYTAPVPGSWYLKPATFGTGSKWHGPSITRTIPADAAGEVGAKNFSFSYCQKMSIGSSSSATQEIGLFQVLLVSGSGSNKKILAGVNIFKGSNGKTANLRFYVNGKTVETISIDLSLNNKYFGNNTSKITTVKTSTITKTGKKVEFNIGGIKKTFTDNGIADTTATEITFLFAQYGTKPVLSYNGLYWAKFVKNNCDTWQDIPNKFSSNDVVTADCKDGEVYLNDTPVPSLGALGNDWEDFYLSPGLNQIGYSYSDWVADEYAPSFKMRYREVFL